MGIFQKFAIWDATRVACGGFLPKTGLGFLPKTVLTAARRAVDALLIKASRLFFQMVHCKNRPACNNDNVDENKLEQYFAAHIVPEQC
jgi:hypothetical protein